MKKRVAGLAAIGGIIALSAAARRGGYKIAEHCKSMDAKCREMMASQSGQHEAAGMRERCQQMMAAHTGQGEKTEPPEHPEQEAPQFVGSGEAVPV
jgi:hypothetical protein